LWRRVETLEVCFAKRRRNMGRQARLNLRQDRNRL